MPHPNKSSKWPDRFSGRRSTEKFGHVCNFSGVSFEQREMLDRIGVAYAKGTITFTRATKLRDEVRLGDTRGANLALASVHEKTWLKLVARFYNRPDRLAA